MVHSREQKYTCKYEKAIILINKLQLIVTQKQYDCHTATMYVFKKYGIDKQISVHMATYCNKLLLHRYNKYKTVKTIKCIN